MSYILDALRRAESERERGSIPTLHAQSQPPAAADAAAAGPRRHPWLWGAAALGLLLLGGLAAQWLRPEAPVPAAAVTPAAAPVALPTPAPVALMPPAPAPRVEARAPEAAVPPPTVALPAAPPASAERPVPALSELPEALRRELPALATSGAMYSETPANRMLIINGQLLHEGDRVAANLVLEQIQLKRAVLSYKGQRFGISY